MRKTFEELQQLTQPQPGTTGIPAAVQPQMNLNPVTSANGALGSLSSHGSGNSTDNGVSTGANSGANGASLAPTSNRNSAQGSGMIPGPVQNSVSSSFQGSVPSSGQSSSQSSNQTLAHGTTQGAIQATVQETAQSAAQGTMQGSTQGSVQGSVQGYSASGGHITLAQSFNPGQITSNNYQADPIQHNPTSNPNSNQATTPTVSQGTAHSPYHGNGYAVTTSNSPMLQATMQSGTIAPYAPSSVSAQSSVSSVSASISTNSTSPTTSSAPTNLQTIPGSGDSAHTMNGMNTVGKFEDGASGQVSGQVSTQVQTSVMAPAQNLAMVQVQTSATGQAEPTTIHAAETTHQAHLGQGAINHGAHHQPSQGHHHHVSHGHAMQNGHTIHNNHALQTNHAAQNGHTPSTEPASQMTLVRPTFDYNIANANLNPNWQVPIQTQVVTQISPMPTQDPGTVINYSYGIHGMASAPAPTCTLSSAPGQVSVSAPGQVSVSAPNQVSLTTVSSQTSISAPSLETVPASAATSAASSAATSGNHVSAHNGSGHVGVFHQSHPAQMAPSHSMSAPNVIGQAPTTQIGTAPYPATTRAQAQAQSQAQAHNPNQSHGLPGTQNLNQGTGASGNGTLGNPAPGNEAQSNSSLGNSSSGNHVSGTTKVNAATNVAGNTSGNAMGRAAVKAAGNPAGTPQGEPASRQHDKSDKTPHMSMFDSGMPKAPVRKSVNLTPSQEAMSFLRHQGVTFPEKKKPPKGNTDSPQSAFDMLLKILGDKAEMDTTDFNVSYQDYWIMRQNENRMVQQEVKQSQDAYFRDYMKRVSSSGEFNPNYTFEKLRCDQLNMNAFKFAEQFVSDMDQQLDGTLFLILGNAGTGKTALCHAMAQRYLSLKADMQHCSMRRADLPIVILTNFAEIVNLKMFSFNENASDRAMREKRFDELCNVDMLIIDDVCEDREVLSAFAQKVLAEILSQRCEQHIPLVMSTPLGNTEIADKIGVRCFERINSYSVIATCLEGGSRRPRAIRLRRWAGSGGTTPIS